MSHRLSTLMSSAKSYSEFLKLTADIPVLTADQELDLIIDVIECNDQNAIDTLVYHSLRYVAKIANRFAYNAGEFEEYFQEGCVGLIAGIKSFDIYKSDRLSTHTTWNIRGAIFTYIKKNHRIIPVLTDSTSVTVFYKINKYTDANGKFDAVGLAEEVELPVERVQEIYEKITGNDQSMSIVSEDGEDATFEIDDSKMNPEYMFTEGIFSRALSSEKVKEAVSQLPEVEQDIVRRRFLLEKKETRKKIAESYDFSVSTIPNYEKRALQRLRSILENEN